MDGFNVLQTIFESKNSSWKPSDKIPILTKEIDELKFELKTFINNSDYDIETVLHESNELNKESNSLLGELQSCQEQIENETMSELLKTIENHDILSKELLSVQFTYNIVNQMIEYGKLIQEFEAGRDAQSYTKAVDAIHSVCKLLDSPVDGFESLNLYSSAKMANEEILENIVQDLFKEWDRMVNWSIRHESDNTIINLMLKLGSSTPVIEVLTALEKCGKLREKVSILAEFLLQEVFVPLINNNALISLGTEDVMKVTINNKTSSRPNYTSVIHNLTLVFNFIDYKLNIEFYDDKSIMRMIGVEICEKFKDILVKECLIHTVPNNTEELLNYNKITVQIQEFQHFLAYNKFFPSRDYSLLDYLDKIEEIFAERSSHYFLETARNIMMKDLSTVMSIGVESIPDIKSGSNLETIDKDDEEAINNIDKTIPKSLFYFPRCMISKTTQELLDLVYVMMEQSVQCSDVVCKKLYNATRLVFELYDAVVPYHHENYLQTIPQYVALFHNNCMYLAHNLLMFGDKWSILMEGRKLDYPICFVDLVQKLRDLGYKHLTIHMQQQRKQILDSIRSSDLNCIGVKDVLGDNAEAAVRQCLRQLQLLKNVWIGVFPSNVFTRLMATLVNMFVDELIHRVCTVEDISMEMATQLTEMYTLVVQKLPQLFENQSQLENHVKSWIKLQELIFVLNGSLKDIENHWNDGTGPLAVHFRTEELRSLIKALFQNTQLRSNLLSKIK